MNPRCFAARKDVGVSAGVAARGCNARRYTNNSFRRRLRQKLAHGFHYEIVVRVVSLKRAIFATMPFPNRKRRPPEPLCKELSVAVINQLAGWALPDCQTLAERVVPLT